MKYDLTFTNNVSSGLSLLLVLTFWGVFIGALTCNMRNDIHDRNCRVPLFVITSVLHSSNAISACYHKAAHPMPLSAHSIGHGYLRTGCNARGVILLFGCYFKSLETKGNWLSNATCRNENGVMRFMRMFAQTWILYLVSQHNLCLGTWYLAG